MPESYRTTKWLALLALVLPLTAHAACATSFATFLARFERSASFQQDQTSFPLRTSWLDADTEPEPASIQRLITSPDDARYRQLRFPTRLQQQSRGLEKDIRRERGQWHVRLHHPDSGESYRYVFAANASCWQLQRIDDYSL